MIHIQDECVRRFIRRIADILKNHHYASTDFGVGYDNIVGQLGSYKNSNCPDHRDVIGVRLYVCGQGNPIRLIKNSHG